MVTESLISGTTIIFPLTSAALTSAVKILPGDLLLSNDSQIDELTYIYTVFKEEVK